MVLTKETCKLLRPAAIAALVPLPVFASSGETGTHFLWLLMLLFLARLSSLVERIGLPAVLGELAVGILLGNIALLGVGNLDIIREDAVLQFLAQLGLVILLFQVGLESDLAAMRQVGLCALRVAVVGVALPFVLGAGLIGPWLLPQSPVIGHLFLGAALTATSVGITGRVFKDAGWLSSKEAQIVLGSAVIDDVLGLIILAVISAIATQGTVGIAGIGFLSAKAFAFLAGVILVGQWLAPMISRVMAQVHDGAAMQFTVVIGFCLGFAWLADLVGLASIVGAFAAGLILDAAVVRPFKQGQSSRIDGRQQMREMIEPVGFLVSPLFFVITGMQVDLRALIDLRALGITAAITLVALFGKVMAGLVAGKGTDRWLVGWGMAPRGEVGLIFASIGKQLGVMNGQTYSVIVTVVVLTTLVTPPVLAYLIRRRAEHLGA